MLIFLSAKSIGVSTQVRRLLTKLSASGMEKFQFLSKATVRMRNRVSTENIIEKIVSAGPEHLQVITDFDYTISKSRTSSNEINPTTHGVFDVASNGVDPVLLKRLRDLRDYYYPIEMDTNLTHEDKIPHMEQWWILAHDLISKADIDRSILETYVRRANIELRDGWCDFLRLTENSGIPVIIFSAGIGDLIDIILRQNYGSVPANVHLISNLMKFDEEEKVVGFNPPLIHTFNKNRSVIQKEQAFFDHLASRPNVLMLGDTLGDLNMDVGVVNEGAILKLGFLNQNVQESLPKYLEGYNVVLANDQTFDVPLAILSFVFGQNSPQL